MFLIIEMMKERRILQALCKRYFYKVIFINQKHTNSKFEIMKTTHLKKIFRHYEIINQYICIDFLILKYKNVIARK